MSFKGDHVDVVVDCFRKEPEVVGKIAMYPCPRQIVIMTKADSYLPHLFYL